MKKFIYFLAILVSSVVFSQQKAIEITNIKSGKIKMYEENQRVKIRTLNGKKYVGNLTFADEKTLIIDNQFIKSDSLLSIKSQPKVLGTVKTVVLAVGMTVIGSSVIVASTGGDAAFLIFSIGAGITISSGLIDTLNGNHSNRKWTFKIIEK